MSELLTSMAVATVGTLVACILYTEWEYKRAYEKGYQEGVQKGLDKGLYAQVTKIRALRDGRYEVYWKDPDNDD